MNRDLETLSAFLDGETSELETRRVMRDIDNADLDALSRWQLARDVMHKQSTMSVPAGFNASLSAALAAEQAPSRRPAWLGSVSRLAVAASVAAATVVADEFRADGGQLAGDGVGPGQPHEPPVCRGVAGIPVFHRQQCGGHAGGPGSAPR